MIINATEIPARDGMMDEETTWQKVKKYLREESDTHYFNCYIRDTEEVELMTDNGTNKLMVGVDDQYKQRWLQERITGKANRIASGVLGRNTKVEFIIYAHSTI